MRLSKDSKKRLEDFTKEFFRNEFENLPEMIIYAKSGAKWLTKILNIQGITLGKYVFLKPSLIWRDEQDQICAPRWLIAHEYAHVLQYRRLGMTRFLITYFIDFFRGLKRFEKWDFDARVKAYLEIPHEIEARCFEDDYLKWLKNQQKGKS